MTTEYPIRRAWSATCPDGWLRDHFANGLCHLITEENQESASLGFPPELVDDFVDRCDKLFDAARPDTVEAVDELIRTTETTELFDLVGDE